MNENNVFKNYATWSKTNDCAVGLVISVVATPFLYSAKCCGFKSYLVQHFVLSTNCYSKCGCSLHTHIFVSPIQDV